MVKLRSFAAGIYNHKNDIEMTLKCGLKRCLPFTQLQTNHINTEHMRDNDCCCVNRWRRKALSRPGERPCVAMSRIVVHM